MHWIALQPQREAPPSATLTDPLTALGWWALQFTPKVALLQGALLLEVSASTRLWGGQAALMRHIYTSNKPLALTGYAQGDTSLIALARLIQMQTRSASAPLQPQAPERSASVPVARQAPAWSASVPVQPDRQASARAARPRPTAPDDLPLATLGAAQPHLVTLTRLGCTCWGDLRALPRDGLARRFGAALVDALDQAYGQRPDMYPWLTLPEVFEAALELPSQVENASALLFGARRLLGQMQVWLQLRQRGVLALELSWQMDARRLTAKEGALVLRTAEPTQGTEHLQRLLAERLNQITLPAPVLGLRLRSLETQPLKGVSASLLLEDVPQGDTLAQLLERLSARLGAGKVLQLQAQADHRPEHMQAWVQAESATNSIAVSPYFKRAGGQKSLKISKSAISAPDGWASALYPTWLLAQPLKLSVRQGCPYYQGPLTLLAGPQRLESGWWALPQATQPAVPALRDYFVAASSSAVLLWVYRERLGSTAQAPSEDWFLQGVFA